MLTFYDDQMMTFYDMTIWWPFMTIIWWPFMTIWCDHIMMITGDDRGGSCTTQQEARSLRAVSGRLKGPQGHHHQHHLNHHLRHHHHHDLDHHYGHQVAKHSKDFRSRTLIKEALMENDFLKNLSQSQVMIRGWSVMMMVHEEEGEMI